MEGRIGLSVGLGWPAFGATVGAAIVAVASARAGRASRLVGHKGTAVTEKVYRKQLRPALEQGTAAMNEISPAT
ncbi:MAG: hypothetical protein JWN52_5278 [Actinomycetia bacterium]|nr:hypothetical protein [Actinomycetes bacterium]